MSIIIENNFNFEELITNYCENAKKAALNDLASWLERKDLQICLNRPKYFKIVKLDTVKAASEMSYEKAGRYGCDKSYPVSKSTVCRAIRDMTFSIDENLSLKENENYIHVQNDEKFLNVLGYENKKKRYTCTIFKGTAVISKKGKIKLLNRRIISSDNLKEFFDKINYYLVNQYKVTSDTTIFLSGDLATYIQNGSEKITPCKAIYVPDKFHVKSVLRESCGLLVKNNELANEKYRNELLKVLSNDKELMEDKNVAKIVRLLKRILLL